MKTEFRHRAQDTVFKILNFGSSHWPGPARLGFCMHKNGPVSHGKPMQVSLPSAMPQPRTVTWSTCEMEILTTPLSTSVPRRLGPLKESFFFCSTGTTMACDSVKLLTMHSSCTHRMHPKSGNFNSKLQKNSSIPHSVIISAFRRAICSNTRMQKRIL